jgi:hypothetical protein
LAQYFLKNRIKTDNSLFDTFRPLVICIFENKQIRQKLEAQWAEPVSLIFYSALRKLNAEPPIGASHQVLVIWLNSYKEEDI